MFGCFFVFVFVCFYSICITTKINFKSASKQNTYHANIKCIVRTCLRYVINFLRLKQSVHFVIAQNSFIVRLNSFLSNLRDLHTRRPCKQMTYIVTVHNSYTVRFFSHVNKSHKFARNTPVNK